MAAFAVALHTILAGVAPLLAASAANTVDPFTVICHSESGFGIAGQGSGHPDHAPSQACDHCNLCHVAVAKLAPDLVVIGSLAPAPLLRVLTPVSTAKRSYLATTSKLARGPPQPA